MPTINRKVTSKVGLNKIRSDISHASFDYRNSLMGLAVYKTHNGELSNDLVQTTFLKALLYLQKGGHIDTMRPFLNHILRNLIIDEYRKRKVTSLDTLLELGLELSFDDYESHINKLDGKKIVRLIDSLPLKYQLVMRMKYIQDLSLTEIAELTHQTKNAVAVQTYRGLQKLKDLAIAGQKETTLNHLHYSDSKKKV